jgi:hypothetical protein
MPKAPSPLQSDQRSYTSEFSVEWVRELGIQGVVGELEFGVGLVSFELVSE